MEKQRQEYTTGATLLVSTKINLQLVQAPGSPPPWHIYPDTYHLKGEGDIMVAIDQ